MTPVIIEDEYQYFKQTILRLKVEKTEMLKFLLFNMENKEKNDLNDILMCQKIVFDQAESKIFRKVVKVKNKNK